MTTPNESVEQLRADLTAARERIAELEAELVAERNLHGQTRVVVEELNTIANDLRNAGKLPHIRSEAIRLLREDQAALRQQLTAAQARVAELEADLKAVVANSSTLTKEQEQGLRAELSKTRKACANYCDKWSESTAREQRLREAAGWVPTIVKSSAHLPDGASTIVNINRLRELAAALAGSPPEGGAAIEVEDCPPLKVIGTCNVTARHATIAPPDFDYDDQPAAPSGGEVVP